jgi:hypothetical protein
VSVGAAVWPQLSRWGGLGVGGGRFAVEDVDGLRGDDEGHGVAALLHLGGELVDEVAPGPADEPYPPERCPWEPQQDIHHELRGDVHHRMQLLLLLQRLDPTGGSLSVWI